MYWGWEMCVNMEEEIVDCRRTVVHSPDHITALGHGGVLKLRLEIGVRAHLLELV
jgi:hypothetical protein